MIVVLTTAPSAEEAETLAQKIVEERLAACVQVLPQMKSFYLWEGKMRADAENLLLIKTRKENFQSLKDLIQANHSYQVPEIVSLPVSDVEENYLDWVRRTGQTGLGID